MHLRTISRHLVFVAILLGIAHSVYPIRPSVLLKRALLRRRLLTLPGGVRPKRQLFREDIPRHRPLTGNTYYLHAGFPHPSRWHEGQQVIQPDLNPITHHHFQNKPGLHDVVHGTNNHDHHNNHVNNEHNNQHHHVHPPPHNHQHHHIAPEHHHHHLQNGPHHQHDPAGISIVNNKTPHSVNIHSSIVHSNGLLSGGVIDNAIGNHHTSADQANFDPLLNPYEGTGHNLRNIPGKRPAKRPKPHSDPEPFDDDYGNGGDYGARLKDGPHGLHDQISPLLPPETVAHPSPLKQPERKPKTIIHYHPVTVGNIINFNDDNKPELIKPVSSYGPPDHVPGFPLAHKDEMLSIAEPFIKSPFKSVNGPPEFLDQIQYGPPQHVPGVPLGNFDLSPMLPSFGPPIKPDTDPAVGVALPVIAHIHSGPPRHHHHHHHHHHRKPPRVKGRGHRQHQFHLHHIHHPPTAELAPLTGPFYDVKHPSYVVHGHVPSYHSGPHFHSQSHQHHKTFWSWR